MRKTVSLLLCLSVALFFLNAEDAKQNFLDRQSIQNGQIVTSVVRATDYNIIADLKEMKQQNYRPFFFKIIDDCAYLMYQKGTSAIQGEYLFCQETVTRADTIVKKQVSNILDRFKEQLVPVSVRFDGTYSLWYQIPDFYQLFDQAKVLGKDTPFLVLGDSPDEIVANLKKAPDFIPYGLNCAGGQGYVTVVLPAASVRVKDVQILSIPLDKLNTVVIPENWSAVGADTDGKNLMILIILL